MMGTPPPPHLPPPLSSATGEEFSSSSSQYQSSSRDRRKSRGRIRNIRRIRRGVFAPHHRLQLSSLCRPLQQWSLLEKVFVILSLIVVVALPGVQNLDQSGCDSSISPPCPLNARLVSSLVNSNNSGSGETRVECDEGFELFGDSLVTCAKGKWTSGYCATNVATNLPSNQSSTASSGGKMSPHLANDGVLSTCSQTLKELNPYWKVDLLQSHHVTGVRISVGDASMGMGNTESSPVDLEVRVGNNPLGLKNPLCVWQPATEFAPDEKKLFACARPIQGRHLSIQIVGSENVLKLCQVEVFATDGIPSQRCSPESSLPEDVVSFNGSCYEFATKTGATFSGARAQCVSRKGDFLGESSLKPNSPTLNLVTTTLDRLKPSLRRPLIWIGVERDPGFTSRTWRWVDSGLVVKKPNWGKDQPNNYNGEQNCATLDGGRDWSWNDVGCGLDLFHWICLFPPKRCGSPDRGAGTELATTPEDYLVGTSLTYKCSKPGYFVDGEASRVCQANGLWAGSAPPCKFVDCGDEPLKQSVLENGKVILPENNSTFFGAELRYECAEGYAMTEGDGKRTCGRDGIWSGTMPKCLNSICPDPQEVVNGTFSSTGKTAGSKVSYSCNSGHVLIGAAEIACQLGGTWSSPPPMCKYVICEELPSLKNGTFRLEDPSTSPMLGSTASAKCELNYELGDDRHAKIVCSEAGNWETYGNFGSRTPPWSSLIKCELITCEEPEVPDGSFVTGYDFSVGSEITYHCEAGHVMVGGTEIRRCTLKGTWSGLAPQCRFIDCGRAQTIPFGQVVYPSGKTFLNSTVSYSCAPNFRLAGPETRTCTRNGVWSGTTPKCEEVRCNFPNLPPSSVAAVAKNDRFNSQSLISAENAASNGTFKIGTVLKIRCERGHVLEGGKSQSCEAGGTWKVTDSSPPRCRFVDCSEPPDIAHGKKSLPSNTTVFGSAIIYECDPGHKLVGNSRRLCLENATWSGYDPHCREITCEAVETTNATVDYTGFGVANIAKYSCPKGSYLQGDATRECIERGVWSGQSPSCQYVRCPPPPNAPNARVFLVNVTTVYSSLVEYHCAPGYSLAPGSKSVLACTEYSKWNPPTPPSCLDQEEFSAVSKQMKEAEGSAGSDSTASIVGIVIGLLLGFTLLIGALFFLLYHVRKRRRNEKNNNASSSGDLRRGAGEPSKGGGGGEPMVVFPTPTPSSMATMTSFSHLPPHLQQQQSHYYDNPTVDPIYENLDDYGVTSSSSDVVTINGVAVA